MWKKSNELKDESSDNNANMRSVIGAKSIIIGEAKGDEDLLVLGLLEGSIKLPKNTVTVGKTGVVKGTIFSQSIMIEGKVEGDLNASARVILRSSAKVTGNILSGSLVMEDGCFLKGKIDMPKEAVKVIPQTTTNNKEGKNHKK